MHHVPTVLIKVGFGDSHTLTAPQQTSVAERCCVISG